MKYKNQRNMIIKIYYENYYPKKIYLSASELRKRISDDAYWLMRIHVFLEGKFLINITENSTKNNKYF